MGYVFKKAPFPLIMTIVSFLLFLLVYYFVTATTIEPYYLKGLIFAVPFICFGAVTFFTAKGNLKFGWSVAITIILGVILSIVMFAIFSYFAFLAAITDTNDVAKYDRVMCIKDYPDNKSVSQFPEEIPKGAINVAFHYNPPFLQAGERIILKYNAPSRYISDCTHRLKKSAKWVGKLTDAGAKNNGIFLSRHNLTTYVDLTDDFTLYLFDSKPYKKSDWNHGRLSIAGINEQTNEVVFYSGIW